jgi:hypothetical protein
MGLAGLASGEGLLLAPAAGRIVAYAGANWRPPAQAKQPEDVSPQQNAAKPVADQSVAGQPTVGKPAERCVPSAQRVRTIAGRRIEVAGTGPVYAALHSLPGHRYRMQVRVAIAPRLRGAVRVEGSPSGRGGGSLKISGGIGHRANSMRIRRSAHRRWRTATGVLELPGRGCYELLLDGQALKQRPIVFSVD